jgi:carbamoyl-phosphate synthase large subunit
MINILVLGVGGPTPRSFALSLQKYSRFDHFRFVGTDINPLSYGLYQKDLFDQSYLIPRPISPQYWQVLEEIIGKETIDIAIVLSELEVLEWSKRNQNGRLPCKALLPDPFLAEVLFDKSKMTDLLDPLQLVPKSISFSRDQKDLSEIFRQLGADFWVRSSAGTSGLGSLRINGLESLENWIQINPHVEQFLASQYLPGRNLACKLLYYEGKLVRAATAERVNYIMSKVAPSGITGNTSFGRLLNESHLVDVSVKAMDYLFSVTGASKHGFFTVDLKEDEHGRAMITEINIRHVAFTQCFAAAGANFAEDTVRLLLEDPSFNKEYMQYIFEEDLIFLRDVDQVPILMKESDLLSKR